MAFSCGPRERKPPGPPAATPCWAVRTSSDLQAHELLRVRTPTGHCRRGARRRLWPSSASARARSPGDGPRDASGASRSPPRRRSKRSATATCEPPRAPSTTCKADRAPVREGGAQRPPPSGTRRPFTVRRPVEGRRQPRRQDGEGNVHRDREASDRDKHSRRVTRLRSQRRSLPPAHLRRPCPEQKHRPRHGAIQ